MKAYYNIYLTIDGIRVWMNKYTANQSYSFSNNLCSTSWKSVTDTASCKLVFNDRNVAELSEIISKLIEAQQSFPPKDIGFEVLDEDETKTIFRGVLDLGKLSIESAKLPGSVSITAKSPMDGLDVKPNVNLVLYPATVQEVVERCIWEAASSHSVEWRCSVGSRQIEVPFVVTDEDSDTWRNKIDTLLTEMGGYTLAFDHSSGKFYVFKVNDAKKAFSDIPVNYHVQTKLKSSTTKFAKDGVVVSYGNVKKSEKQYVYMHDISLENKSPLFPKGDEIKAGQHYPYDSDVTKTFEEYEGSLLDYGQLIGNTRKANKHIGIYYVDPESTKVEIVASDMAGNSVSDWYDNLSFISPNGGFTYPAGGEFYPRKAWLSFRNKTDKSINITKFHISGDTYYSDAEYSVVMPIDCTDPEEYSAKYISKTDSAREFANFLMNLKRFGSDTSTWTERWEDHNLGDKVKLHHKGGNTIDAVIVRKDSVIYGDELWAKVTAVSIDGWSFEQPSVVQGSVQSPSLLDPYENAKKNGYTGSREQWESRNDIFYLWSSSHSEFVPVGDKGWSTDWKDIMTNKPAGNPFLWARVGEDREPFLFQGVKGDPGDRIYQWRLSKYADYEGMGADLSNFKADGNLVFYNGQLLFDGNTEWIGQDYPRPVVDENYPYLWERYSDDKGITWSEAYLVQSLMPRTIRIISSRPSFDKSARGVVKANQTVTLSVVTNGIGDKAVQWTTSGGTLSSAEGRLVTLVIPKGFLENSVTVSVVSAGVSDTLTLRANTVGGTEPKKLPTVNRDEGQEFATELEDGDVLVAGDYCIAIIDGYTVPCRYDGTSFVEVEGSEDNASQIMGGIIEEALSMSDTVKTGKFIYAFIKNLVATNAFIENLKAMNVIVDKDNFKFEIATTDKNGAALATPVVRIQYAGSTIFQVNPKNGNVFFGQPNSELSAPESGFMYRASDKSIVSVDSKLIISADGTIKAEGADISGNINATSGSFVGSIVASSGRFNGLLETPCIRTEINSSSATVITDSISAWSGETNDWTQVRQFYAHFKKTGLPLGSFVPCTASFDSEIIGYKLKLTGSMEDANYPPITVDFYRRSYILSEKIKSYYEHWEVSHSYTYVRAGVKQSFTITSKFGGVDMLMLDIPLEQGGLASNQVYRTTDGFLKIYE